MVQLPLAISDRIHIGSLGVLIKKQAKNDLTKAVRRYAKELGANPKSITMRDTVSRWGSCSARGTLSFCWRIVMAPPEVLDYLAAHEVAHLREMNHSPDFWGLVKQICPQYETQKLWLTKEGAKLHAIV